MSTETDSPGPLTGLSHTMLSAAFTQELQSYGAQMRRTGQIEGVRAAVQALQEFLEKMESDTDIASFFHGKSVAELGMSSRATNGLNRAGILTIDQLVAKRESEILNIDVVGPKTLNEIKQALAVLGLKLAD